MATHSSIRAWKIPWSEEPGGLPSMGFKKSDTTENSIVLIVKLEIGYHWSFNLVFLQYCVGYSRSFLSQYCQDVITCQLDL